MFMGHRIAYQLTHGCESNGVENLIENVLNFLFSICFSVTTHILLNVRDLSLDCLLFFYQLSAININHV